MKIHKTKLASPYLPNGKTRFNLRGVPAVYIIYEKSEIVYIGSGKDGYKTFYRHFQKWIDRTQYRATFNKNNPNIKVRLIYCNTIKRAKDIEKALILKYRPEDNVNTFENFEADEKEKEIINFVTGERAGDIVQYKSELPF